MDFITASLRAPHGFFTRAGGVSTGPYASLNCSLSGADDRARVLENRRRVAVALAVPPDHLLGLNQVHGTTVVTATAAWPIGGGPAADALVTAAPGLALGIITADCAPVLFASGDGKITGAAHAGWRGGVAGVLEATVTAMQSLGATDINAAIGPCIHQDSYEVRADLRDAVLAHDKSHAVFFTPGRSAGHWQFDLPGYCAARLTVIGIAATVLPHDTCAEEMLFFSHRRRTLRAEPSIGHQISVITCA